MGKKIAQTIECTPTQCVAAVIGDEEVDTIYYPKRDCQIAIRKLTPRECFRLQAFPDELFEKAQFVNSDAQLYKQAGNAVSVCVVYEIAKRLKEKEEKNEKG